MRSIWAVALVLGASCAGGDDGGDEPVAPPQVPAQADFYQPPDPIPTGDPGQVIWVEPLGAPADVEAWMQDTN